MRRVLVLPQQPEFHPGGHSPLHHPPPPPHAHLPAFIPHPAMMPPPPHLYTGMAGGVSDMSSQYISQYHPAHIYSEQGELTAAQSASGPLAVKMLFVVLSTLFAQSSYTVQAWDKLFSLSVSQPHHCPVYLYDPLTVTCCFQHASVTMFFYFFIVFGVFFTPLRVSTNSRMSPFCFPQSLQILTPHTDAHRLFTETIELAKHTSVFRRN